jgi:predicted phosphodiesterase
MPLTTHRIRVTDEELELVNTLRKERLKTLSGSSHKNIQAAIAVAESATNNEPVQVGAVFGGAPKAPMIAGELRDENVTDITSSRIGIISDAHWPFHDLRQDNDGNFYGAYLTAIEWLKEQKIGTLILNGDMLDCFNLSSHEKIERKRSWKWELDVSRAMIKHLREFFGDKVRIVYREGNHEERFKRYLAGKAKELEGSIWLEELLGLREHGIEWVQDRDKIVAGKLWIDHGHEWFGGGGVNPARNYRMKAVDNVLVGHVHKTSTDLFRKPLDGSFIAGWSVGCLCDLNPRYAPRNNWNHGVALVELEADGNFTVHNKVILQGKVR